MTSRIIEEAFKTSEEGISVYADIIIPSTASESQSALPVLVWWHGGGLLQGTRKGTAPHLQKAPEQHNLIVVSADYRLAPQVRMPAILSDVTDLLKWIDSEQFAKLTNNKADQKKVFVSGSSAGGWLALLAASGLGFKECGLKSPPKPFGCIPIYPISDLTNSFWNTKQHPVSYFPRIIDGEKELGKDLDPNSAVLTNSALDSSRSVFYHYMIQE